MSIEAVAGWVFVALAFLLAAFQIALSLGAPWGSAAYGGSNQGVLPKRLRIVSAVAGFGVYPIATLFVVDVAGIADTGLGDGDSSRVWLWVLTGVFTVGAVANFASRSKIERVWGPVALILAGCCAVLALGL